MKEIKGVRREMREILFRAFVKDKSKIYDIKKIDFDYGMVWFEEENKHTDTMRMFDQIELMQYTGLTDKNGTKIFEGDICLCDRHISDRYDKQTFIIDFEPLRGWFGITQDGWGEFDGSSFEYAEVIGNIHDQNVGEK